LAQDAGTPVNLKGAYVDTITKSGPADKAGIHGSTIDQYSKKHLGDIIISEVSRLMSLLFITSRDFEVVIAWNMVLN
jgi:hypothetical protein